MHKKIVHSQKSNHWIFNDHNCPLKNSHSESAAKHFPDDTHLPVLSEMTGIVSEVEVNVDASDIPTVAPNPELDLCNVCGNTPCKFVDYKDEIFDTVIGHLFQAFPPCIDSSMQQSLHRWTRRS